MIENERWKENGERNREELPEMLVTANQEILNPEMCDHEIEEHQECGIGKEREGLYVSVNSKICHFL